MKLDERKGEACMEMKEVMAELEQMGTAYNKKRYLSNGAVEPVFGVGTGKMKPMSKKIGVNHALAESLYATGNYDAMYFAGIIADPNAMTVADYNRWMDEAYFFMLSDYVVAVTLSESDIAEEVADEWITSEQDLRKSAGWSTYCWLLGSRKDEEFSADKLSNMLDVVKASIHDETEHTKGAMNNFVYTVGTSYLPLHDKAVQIADEMGTVHVEREKKKSLQLNALVNIEKQVEKDRIGFKRKYVRC